MSTCCYCIVKTDKMLAPMNARLCTVVGASNNHSYPILALWKLDTSKEGPLLLPRFCPFCGIELPKADGPGSESSSATKGRFVRRGMRPIR